MRKRTEKSQKLINDGKIWRDESTGKWSRKCPQCSVSIKYVSFDSCQSSHKRNSKCLNCCHPKIYKNTKLLIDSKLIWENSDKTWSRKCPLCLDALTHSQISHCVYGFRKRIPCISCSKSGKNNPNYGRPRTDESKEKVRISNIGKHVCSEEHRKKLSKSQINSGKNYFIKTHGKNKYKRKLYAFPNGKQVKVQGHETHTLNYLLSRSINCDDIKVKFSEKPIIFYNWSGSLHRYLPDCYLPNSNTIVETKSPWTWKFQKDRNMAKIRGSLDAGYNVRLIVWEVTKYNKKLIMDTTYRA